MPRAKKLYYILIERDENKSITQVRVFRNELECWHAYETCPSTYATVHAAPAEGAFATRVSPASSEVYERFADELPEPEVRFGNSPDY